MAAYHWIVTLQYKAPEKAACHTLSGTIRPAAGVTRAEVFQDIVNGVRQEIGLPRSSVAAVVFFSLEPETLPGGESGVHRG